MHNVIRCTHKLGVIVFVRLLLVDHWYMYPTAPRNSEVLIPP